MTKRMARPKPPIVYCEGQLPHGCGRRVNKYPITLSKSMVTGLKFCADYYSQDNPMPLGILSDLFGGQKSGVYMNFHGLRHFGLTARPRDEQGRERIGFWYVTDVGRWFLADEHDVTRRVWVYANQVVESDPVKVGIKDVPYIKVDYELAAAQIEGVTEEEIERMRELREQQVSEEGPPDDEEDDDGLDQGH